MENKELIDFLKHVGKDPSRLIFEDELTGIRNRRFLLNYFDRKVAWDSLDQNPVSLLMMDIDYFKKINDTHGHGAGDQALIYIAKILKAVSDKRGLPIRYAGDEFMILLPRHPKEVARKVAEALRALVQRKPFICEEAGGELPITLSIGVATAPDDARSGKTLVQQADTALYQSKQAGRDRVTAAGEAPPEAVLAKTIIHQIEETILSGRKPQLAQVTACLKRFSERESQFVLVQGGPGMGKTVFLETIEANLAKSKVKRITVAGQPQELFRPYCLATNIVLSILNQRRDMGAGVIERLDPEDLGYLSHILPQLGGSAAIAAADESVARAKIFNTLLDFIPKLLENRPLILLVDDMHYADEATLHLLRVLIKKRPMPLFICGATAEPKTGDSDPGPLDRFIAAHGEETGIEQVALTPLSTDDIASHIQRLFPGIRMPDEVPQDLFKASNGNPLFLAEILPKLVMDKKIALVDQRWTMANLDGNYLPSSIEEIIAQKVASLDEESRRLLDHTSTMGENVTLSTLTGSTEMAESRVLEFLDQAVAQGLITVDFQMNDETIRFLGKRVREFIYGNINDERKEELHEHIGNYQEGLFEKSLLPSAAALAYHFQRSANLDKARKYEKLQSEHNAKVFNAQEAARYTGDAAEDESEEADEADALSENAKALLPKIIRGFLVSIRNMNLYPNGSAITDKTMAQFKEVLDAILEDHPLVNMILDQNILVVNGEEIPQDDFQSMADAFFKLMRRLELRGLVFRRGVSLENITEVVAAASRTDKSEIREDFWRDFIRAKGINGIKLKQVKYTRLKDQSMARQALGDESPAAAEHQDEELGPEDLQIVYKVSRALLSAYSKIKLYPATGPVATAAMDLLFTEMMEFFKRTPVLTLARVGEMLLANGQKLDAAEHDKVSATFRKFLEHAQLKSLTLSKYTSREEIVKFVQAVITPPGQGLSSAWWLEFAKDQQIRGLLFDQSVYGVMGEAILANLAAAAQAAQAGEGQEGEEGQPGEAPAEETPPEQAGEDIVVRDAPAAEEEDDGKLPAPERFGAVMRGLFSRGREKRCNILAKRLFTIYPELQPDQRQAYLVACRKVLEAPDLAPSARFARIIAEPMCPAYLAETYGILIEIGSLVLHNCATNCVRGGDYGLACWLYGQLVRRVENPPPARAGEDMPQPLSNELDGSIRDIVIEDFIGENTERREGAARFLGCLGMDALGLLFDIVRLQKDLRARAVAAAQIKRLGQEAVERFKAEVVTETTTQRKIRVLEIVDTVTRDVATELAHAVCDNNASVREAGFKLAARIGEDEGVVRALAAGLAGSNLDAAVESADAMGKIGLSGAIPALSSTLLNSLDEKLQVACLTALGRIGHGDGVLALAKVLRKNVWYGTKKKYSADIRALAAYSLMRIGTAAAKAELAGCIKDSEPRVREAAEKAAR
jgi:diguanylate cyclase (GGDEF)-like protein